MTWHLRRSKRELVAQASPADISVMMRVENLRSPSATVGGIVYFGRMLDKIRLHAAGKLPSEYQENLGDGFDEVCCKFLWVEYPAVVKRTLAGGSDEEILEWAMQEGRRPDEQEIKVWNGFMSKRGWRDEVSERLLTRKRDGGWSDREDIQTFFDFIDLDEGRDPASRR